MYATEVLINEHDNVSRLNRIMRAACLRALATGLIRADDFHIFIRIIREYADRHHHGKEEQLLFKEMEQRLGPAAEKLVRNGMLVEHDLGRLYVRQLEEALNRHEQNGNSESLLDIITNSMAYADLLKRHIDRENTVVYPFAERNLPPEVLAQVDADTKTFEATPQSIALLKEVEGLLSQLEQQYTL